MKSLDLSTNDTIGSSVTEKFRAEIGSPKISKLVNGNPGLSIHTCLVDEFGFPDFSSTPESETNLCARG